ncbi:MAG TPA: hypothetical protein LFW10_01650 [Rickettsia endosymbiont of Diachasma alloeum]|nr:hypothetical protein [Rickettsia endosymbiont of Diachasma alloeum]
MKWSKYTFSEKIKIIKSKITHNNIILFLARYGLCKGDKYYTFLQKLYNYSNENNVTLDKEKKEYLEYVLKYIEMFDPLKFTKNEQLQPRYNDEDTLEYYDRTSKNLSILLIKLESLLN